MLLSCCIAKSSRYQDKLLYLLSFRKVPLKEIVCREITEKIGSSNRNYPGKKKKKKKKSPPTIKRSLYHCFLTAVSMADLILLALIFTDTIVFILTLNQKIKSSEHILGINKNCLEWVVTGYPSREAAQPLLPCLLIHINFIPSSKIRDITASGNIYIKHITFQMHQNFVLLPKN